MHAFNEIVLKKKKGRTRQSTLLRRKKVFQTPLLQNILYID